jgi:RNA polymerase sigma factor (sigma-70 family)
MEGDDDVLGDLIKILVPPVRVVLRYRFAGRLDEHEIQDVLIVAVRKLWDARSRFDPARGSLVALYETIAWNEAIDTLRRRDGKAPGRVVSLGDKVDRLPVQPPMRSENEPEPGAAQSKLLADLDTCIRLLSQDEREILLADAGSIEGIADTQMLAVKLGISQGAVRIKRMRGLRKLRELLGSLGHRNEK